MIPETIKTLCLVLQLSSYYSWMNPQRISETKNVPLSKKWSFASNESLQSFFRHTKISGCLISLRFLLGNIRSCTRTCALKLYIYLSPVAAQDVLDLMS